MRPLVYAILFNRQLNGILLVTSNQLALLEAAFPQARKPVPHAVSCISFPSGCPIHYEIHQEGIKEKGGTLEFVNLGVVWLSDGLLDPRTGWEQEHQCPGNFFGGSKNEELQESVV
jgi:hypothetical protein